MPENFIFMVEWKHHGNNYCISTFSDLIYFKGSHASDTENENDGRIKKRRRLSTSMAKPVPKIITPTTITKPATKTATVSTMTKVGKPVVQATTSAKPAYKGTLPASASQVKLLTKTVAITPTLCQAKTVLTYKTLQTGSTSPVKVQTVMSSAASKTQIKPALPSSSPSKSILVPKPHGGTTAVVSKSVANSPGINKSIGNKPTQAIKVTSNNCHYLCKGMDEDNANLPFTKLQ